MTVLAAYISLSIATQGKARRARPVWPSLSGAAGSRALVALNSFIPGLIRAQRASVALSGRHPPGPGSFNKSRGRLNSSVCSWPGAREPRASKNAPRNSTAESRMPMSPRGAHVLSPGQPSLTVCGWTGQERWSSHSSHRKSFRQAWCPRGTQAREMPYFVGTLLTFSLQAVYLWLGW